MKNLLFATKDAEDFIWKQMMKSNSSSDMKLWLPVWKYLFKAIVEADAEARKGKMK